MSVITDNLNIGSNEALITPGQLKSELPLEGAAWNRCRLAKRSIVFFTIEDDPTCVGDCWSLFNT